MDFQNEYLSNARPYLDVTVAGILDTNPYTPTTLNLFTPDLLVNSERDEWDEA